MSHGTLGIGAQPRTAFFGEPVLANRRALPLFETALFLAGCAVVASYAVLAGAHVRDRYQVNFVSGVYAALAANVNDGTLYPEVFDGEHYAGTRYMPLHFVLHAGLARLTGEYLVSGKLLAYALAVVLGVLLFRVLRGLGCGRRVAFALPTLVLVSSPGYLAATTIRGDLLPVVLQLSAVMVAGGGLSRRRAAWAGVLCALAVLTKLTAVWAPAAIICWYLWRDRRCCAVFVDVWLGTLAATLAALHLATSGRMLANFLAVSTSEVQGKGVLLAPLLFLWRVGRGGVLMGLLIPMLLIEGIAALRQRRVTIYHYALAACVPVLVVIYSDMGADANHLLDLVVLAVPLLGCFWAALPRPDESGGGVRTAAALVAGWLLYVAWANTMIFPLLDVYRSVDRGYRAKPLAALVSDGEAVLSEDPWVPLSRGQKPCVLDPFALARMTKTHPEYTNLLLRRIEAREFAHVVLLQRVDDVNPHDRYDWEVRHFGREIVAAIRTHYRLEKHAEDFYVYVPDESDRRLAGSFGTEGR